MNEESESDREATGPGSEPTSVTARGVVALFALGSAGILALAATTPAQVAALPEVPDVPTGVLVAAVVIQSSILLAIAVLIGSYTAPRLGLRSHLLERAAHGTPLLPRLREELPIAAGLGIATGIVIVLAEVILAPTPEGAAGAGATAATVGALLESVPLRFLYGGLTEELLLRWGFMSLVAFALWKTIGRGTTRPSDRLLAASVVIAAVAFGIGHLPTAAVLYGGLTPDVVAWIVAGNAIGGLAFGWLFWRHSLEAAMLAHVFTHVVFVALSLVIVAA